jgi:hypothetical protein
MPEPTTVTKKIKLWDKNAALDKAARHLGLYPRDNAQLMRPVSLQNPNSV